MSTYIPRRRLRLDGVVSLFELALGSLSSDRPGARLPTAPRLRRDIGLPDLDDVRPIYTPFGTKV